MSLKEKLKKMADASAGKFPEATQRIMKTATAKVADSIENRNIPKAGDNLPSFEMPDSAGNVVRSNELAQDGPFVLSFFRGKW